MPSTPYPDIVPLAAFNDNYIWAMNCGDYAMVVDPGAAAPVQAWLQKQAVPLRAIWLTHQHGDHIGGVAALQTQYGCEIYAPDHPAMPRAHHVVSHGLGIALDFGTMHVLHTPGHTGEHHSYYLEPKESTQAGALFCGDTLFVMGCGRVFAQYGGSFAGLYASLQSFKQLPGATQVYGAHEYTLQNVKFCLSEQQNFPLSVEWPALMQQIEARRAQGLPTVPSTLARELQFNPFLRCSNLEQFTQLRLRKDSFKS